ADHRADAPGVVQRDLGDIVTAGARSPERRAGRDVGEGRLQVWAMPGTRSVTLVDESRGDVRVEPRDSTHRVLLSCGCDRGCELRPGLLMFKHVTEQAVWRLGKNCGRLGPRVSPTGNERSPGPNRRPTRGQGRRLVGGRRGVHARPGGPSLRRATRAGL